MKYVIRVDSPRGTEEYDGGPNLREARLEARFFVENTAPHIGVRICKIVHGGSISLVEVAR